MRCVLYWCHSPGNTGSPKWLQLENASCSFSSLHALACSKMPLTDPILKYSRNPIVKHTFKILKQFRRAFSLEGLSKHAPIMGNNMFIHLWLMGHLKPGQRMVSSHLKISIQMVILYHLIISHQILMSHVHNFFGTCNCGALYLRTGIGFHSCHLTRF